MENVLSTQTLNTIEVTLDPRTEAENLVDRAICGDPAAYAAIDYYVKASMVLLNAETLIRIATQQGEWHKEYLIALVQRGLERRLKERCA